MRDLFLFILLSLSAAGFSKAPPNCTEDIILINDVGCSSPCCYQSPANSGHYVFTHSTVEKIDIRSNSANVLSVSFPNLTSVEKSIRISYNQPGSMTSISFPSLRTAGKVEIVGNQSLSTLDLPQLMIIDNDDYDAYLRVQSNDNLALLNAPKLERITASNAGTAYLQIRYNPALGDIDFPILRTVEALEDYGEAYIFIQGNDLVQEISMKNLQRLSAGFESISYLIIDDMLNLQHIAFPNLKELLPTGSEYDFSELTLGHSPQLSEFVFPSLERVTVLQLSGMKGTDKAMFPRLSELQYLWVFNSCANPDSTMRMYTCTQQPLMDVFFSNSDGLCGATGYMLYSENPDNAAACDDSDVCQSFTPDINDCKCGNPGQCMVTPL